MDIKIIIQKDIKVYRIYGKENKKMVAIISISKYGICFIQLSTEHEFNIEEMEKILLLMKEQS